MKMNEHMIYYGHINQLVLDTFKEEILPVANEIFKKNYKSEMELIGNDIYVNKSLNISSKEISKCIEQACNKIGIYF